MNINIEGGQFCLLHKKTKTSVNNAIFSVRFHGRVNKYIRCSCEETSSIKNFQFWKFFYIYYQAHKNKVKVRCPHLTCGVSLTVQWQMKRWKMWVGWKICRMRLVRVWAQLRCLISSQQCLRSKCLGAKFLWQLFICFM